jgi:hypothetical protein
MVNDTTKGVIMKYMEKIVRSYCIYDEERGRWLAADEKWDYVESQLGIAFTLHDFNAWMGN